MIRLLAIAFRNEKRRNHFNRKWFAELSNSLVLKQTSLLKPIRYIDEARIAVALQMDPKSIR